MIITHVDKSEMVPQRETGMFDQKKSWALGRQKLYMPISESKEESDGFNKLGFAKESIEVFHHIQSYTSKLMFCKANGTWTSVAQC